MEHYLVVKALHIIFVVTWFAGLFYIYRLFIYHVEAQAKPDAEKAVLSEQFKIMAKRLWFGITWPSAVLTLIFGSTLIYTNPWFLSQTFFHVKLLFLLGLYGYHLFTHIVFKQLQNNKFKYTSNKLRVMNEVATIFLVAIVFIIELQSSMSWLYGVLGVMGFALLLLAAIKIYKKLRS